MLIAKDELAELRGKIGWLRSQIVVLAEAIDKLRPENPEKARIWEVRLKNLLKELTKAFHLYSTGYELKDERIGPADEPPEMWDVPT